jgi:hypothetical protein
MHNFVTPLHAYKMGDLLMLSSSFVQDSSVSSTPTALEVSVVGKRNEEKVGGSHSRD